MALYHLTTRRNAQSILKHGLIPQIGPRSKRFGEPEARIYCFSSAVAAKDALGNWMGQELRKDVGKFQAAVLQVDLPAPPEKEARLSGIREVAFEIQISRPVPPEQVSICWIEEN